MIRNITKILIVIAAATSLTACMGAHGSKEHGGTLVGAALGGLAGSKIGRGRGQLGAVAAGAVLGAFMGRNVGRSLDRADRMYARRAVAHGLEHKASGHRTKWSNPDSGNHGSVTPVRTYQKPSGQYCREYQQTVSVGGRTERAYGTACRQPDGSWKIVNNSNV